MEVLAALGDAATAAIAVVAILLGVLLVARGPREKRVNGATSSTEQPGPTLLKVPMAAAPDAEPGFVGPEGTVVGHGPIRLGGGGPLGAGAGAPAAPDPAPAPEPPAAPEPESAAEPAPAAEPEPEPGPEPEPEPAAEPDPPQAATDPAAPPAEEAPPQPEDASMPKEPAWRVAARAANSAAHFRQGAIKLGGKPAKREDQ